VDLRNEKNKEYKVAVKKTAKKAPAKPAKKAAAKKAAVKKVAKKAPAKTLKKAAAKPAKKSATKKVAVKKAVAKKAVAKKSAAQPAKKVAVKKAAAKKSVAKTSKAPVKRASTKKAASSAASQTAEFQIPEVPTASRISSTPAPVRPTTATESVPAVTTTPKKGSNRVILYTVVGIAALAAIVATRSNKATTTSTATPAASESASPSQTPAISAATPASSTSKASAAPSASSASTSASQKLAPVGIVAHYTAQGATIFWKADPAANGITNYNVEVSSNGGAWKLISTVPATQTSLDITKQGTSGWMSFRVSAVYSDGTIVAGKVFGLPGQYA